jgi:hypothetical protein
MTDLSSFRLRSSSFEAAELTKKVEESEAILRALRDAYFQHAVEFLRNWFQKRAALYIRENAEVAEQLGTPRLSRLKGEVRGLQEKSYVLVCQYFGQIDFFISPDVALKALRRACVKLNDVFAKHGFSVQTGFDMHYFYRGELAESDAMKATREKFFAEKERRERLILERSALKKKTLQNSFSSPAKSPV